MPILRDGDPLALHRSDSTRGHCSEMQESINVYCDESCHLEHDRQAVMVLGAVWCPADKTREIAARIADIKRSHGLHPRFDMKWAKVSQSNLAFYADVLNYFFDYGDLHFRTLVAHKKGLRHTDFKQDHDIWYFKMYFYLLYPVLDPERQFRIYLDIKDTRSGAKVHKLHDVLCKSRYDFSRQIIRDVQTVRSDEVVQVQLADVLAGVVSYANRGLVSSEAKLALVQIVKRRSRYSLTRTTLLHEKKFNIFIWTPSEASE